MEPFKETQNFLKHWWIILVPVFLIMAATATTGLMANPDATLLSLLITPAVLLLIFLLFAMLTLRTRIDQEGIRWAYTPFIAEKLIPWSEVEQAGVTKYNPLMEYKGWGIRKGWRKKQAVNVWGNMGLLLKFKNGKSLMIGTNNAIAMESCLSYLKKKYHIEALNALP